MKALARLAERNLQALNEAASRNDRKKVEHEYVKISIAHSRVKDFYATVQSASGGTINLELKDTELFITNDATLPTVDELVTHYQGVIGNVVPGAPVHASPYY